MYIQTNLAALNAHRILNGNGGKLSKSTEKLSSGKKINRSADDAAGLAISEKMRAQIRGMAMAQKNAQDGVSLIQTAEGILEGTQDILHRMRELAVQSSSDTNEKMERDALNMEYMGLMDEINKIAEGAEFNGIKLFDGSLAQGQGAQSEVYTLDGSFAATQNPSSPIDWTKIGGIDYSNLVAVVAGEIVPQVISKMASALPNLSDFFASEISIGMSASRDGSGGAYASVSYSWGLNPDQVSLNFNINLDQVDPLLDASGNFKDADSRSNFEAMVAHEMTHALMAVTSTVGMASPDRYPVWFIEGMAQTMSGDMGWITNWSGLDSSSSDAEIQNLLKYSELTSGSTPSYYASGYLATMYMAWEAAGKGAVTSSNLASGINEILGRLAQGDSLDKVIKDTTTYNGLKDFEQSMASNPEALDFVRNLCGATNNGLGSVLASSLSATDLANDYPASNTFLKLDDDNRWVTNVYPTGYSPGNGGGSYTNGSPIDSGGPPTFIPGSGSYGSADGPLTFQVGANDGETISMSIRKLNTGSIGVMHPYGFVDIPLSSTNIKSHTEANAAIDVVDGAIKMISNQRAELGAVQNRLEFRIEGLGIFGENLTDAESRIRDSDLAEEMSTFVKSDMLSKASQSMLAQANSLPQTVLTLLG